MILERHAGLSVNVARAGSDGRPALFAHCSLASHRAWGAVMEGLGDALSMVAPDLPGHGRTEDWDGQGDLHDLCTAVVTSVLEGEGPADLVGHSLGATVVLRVALERPELCRSLTLVEPVLFAAARGTPAWHDHRTAHAALREATGRGEAEAAARGFTDMWGAGQPWDSLPEAHRRNFIARMPLVFAAEPALEDDAAGLLAPGRPEALDRPALLLDGGDSPPVIGAILDALGARLPDAARVTVPGAGHMVPLTHPAPVTRAIRDRLGI